MSNFDLKYSLQSEVLVLRSCHHRDGTDLLAVASHNSVQILQCSTSAIKPLAYFTVGLRITSIAWSPRSVSPAYSDEWFLELAISTHDFGLHVLIKAYDTEEKVYRFGGGLTGHHARVNDITFIGGQGDSARHVATVSDDRNLIVWDLRPVATDEEELSEQNIADYPAARPQPTALVIPFAFPLCSVSSHTSTSKELLVSDSRGSIFLIDWRKDPDEDKVDASSHQNFIELVHPQMLAHATSNTSKHLSGCAAWKIDDPNIVGAVFGSEFALWNISSLKGGKPFETGTGFPKGSHRFRWCPSLTDLFAISPSSMGAMGAMISVNSIDHLQTQAAPIQLRDKPHRVTDFDWIGTRGNPRLAAALGKEIVIFHIIDN